MILSILGLPGIGKSFIAAQLANHLGLQIVSGRELAQEACTFARLSEPDRMIQGDSHFMDKFLAHLSFQPKGHGIVLDGIPRTVEQARALLQFNDQSGCKSYLCFCLTMPPEQIQKLPALLVTRMTCQDCRATYDEKITPPIVAGVCTACGGILVEKDNLTQQEWTTRVRNEIHSIDIVTFYLSKNIPSVLIDMPSSIYDKASTLEQIIHAVSNATKG